MRIILLRAVPNTIMNTYERNVLPLSLQGVKRDVLLSCKKTRQSARQQFFSYKGEAS
jgi:hypothetical protein